MITVICLTGILSGVSAQSIKKDDTLRILIWEGPDPVWPYKSKVYKDLEIFRIVYEPLASFDADDKLVSFLAAEIPTRENGRFFTIPGSKAVHRHRSLSYGGTLSTGNADYRW